MIPMKKLRCSLFALTVVLAACGSADEGPKEDFFPTMSFLKSQVAKTDTTLNTIRLLVYVDSTRTDTTYVPRTEFRTYAADFLSLPDITTPAFAKRYTETKQFDETLNRVLLTYTPVKPEKELIQRQEVLIKPDPSGDQISTIIINTVNNTKDSAVQKRMLWQTDKSFQVVTTRQLPGKPETTTTLRIVWGEE
jgi:hypothetical protein